MDLQEISCFKNGNFGFKETFLPFLLLGLVCVPRKEKPQKISYALKMERNFGFKETILSFILVGCVWFPRKKEKKSY